MVLGTTGLGRAQASVRARAFDHWHSVRRGRKRGGNHSGATAVEYALIVSLIAALIIASVIVLGGKTTQLFDRSCDEVSNATDGTTC